jgi:drug/metabolite transporter (DMT)-like permease
MTSPVARTRKSNGIENPENYDDAIGIKASQGIDSDYDDLDPFPVDRPHSVHYYCDHLRKHWKILALGQLVSLTLASAGAAQATLKLDCHLNAPLFTVSIYYFFLSWHVLILIGRHRPVRHLPVETEETPDNITATSNSEDEIDVSLPTHSFFFGLFPMHKPMWQYFVIALIDVEANAITAFSFRYTTLTSVTLFDNLAIPTAMVLSRCFFSRQYTWIHLSGVAICMVGVFLNMVQDYDDDQDVEEQAEYPHKLRGDMLAITGGILYGINNVMVEVTIRDSGDTTEYLGTMGFFAFLIAIVQALALERQDILDFLGRGDHADDACHSERWWLLSAYVGCTVLSYVGGSRFFQISEATFFGLSLLTGDLWSVIFSIFAEHIIPHSLFFVALVFVLSGMLIYEMAPSPVLADRAQEEVGDEAAMDSTNGYNDDVSEYQQQAEDICDDVELKQIRKSPINGSLV